MRDWATLLVKPLSAIPDDARTYGVSEHDAASLYGLDEDVLESLAAAGLPHRVTHGQRRFEFGDIHYAALRLGSATQHIAAIRAWRDTLELLSSTPKVNATIKFVPFGEAGHHGRPGMVLLPGGETREVDLVSGVSATELEFTIETPPASSLPPDLERLVREVASLDFYYLPPPLQSDAGFARSAGLADCTASSQLIVDDARALGYRVRQVHGLLLSIPYSTHHAWPEVLVAERWIPLDPLVLTLLHRYGDLDAVQWPVTRSLEPLLLRLGSGWEPIISVDGVEVRAMFLTTMTDPDAGT
jgi:hypothetical protein